MPDKPSLEDAYALNTPQDSQRLYRDWAETYDTSFAQAMDYQLPALVARQFQLLGGEGPVLDVGAGTGLLAEHLAEHLDRYEVDGLDISAEMLTAAAAKNIYRRTILGDLTTRLDIADAQYQGITSSGTFTHGHVGPDALNELLRVARPGALFCLSVNARHFESAGFDRKFNELGPAITDFAIVTVPIYGPDTDDAHAADQGHIAHFRKAG